MTIARVCVGLFIAFLLAGQIMAAADLLSQRAVLLPKDNSNTIDIVKTYLQPRLQNGRAKVWVYFTDKGFTEDGDFAKAAAAVQLTDRALNRRIKMGLDRITFLDLPVPADYIDKIEALGAEKKRVSRWLNAASFEIPLALLETINGLPFVAKVRPVATFLRPNTELSDFPTEPTYTPTDKDAQFLNYGTSLGQLTQINVPVVHDKGFNGEGVVVGMFDTGYRKDHEAFADAFGDGRVLAEWDFIFNDGNTQNEAADVSDQHRHGTLTWSTLGGAKSGEVYGPAYGASFLLAKTEDVRSETQVEEDNWAAAVEWADSIGVDVISSSLGYSDWYTYSDFDGESATITIAANLAESLGIVVVTSMGNEGPGAGSLSAPADAFGSISVGAVNSSGLIASFSSRGPTYDGRIKPEVVAQGVSTYSASPTSTTSYTFSNGTSLSCPLAAGCAAVLLEARPDFTPELVRRALIETADQASSPDNTYGWGLIDLDAALHWGARIAADITMGQAPLEVNFFDSSSVEATGWTWSLGDGNFSFVENPTHTYATPGIYSVDLAITTSFGELSASEPNYIVALADTLTFSTDSVFAGEHAVIDIALTNSQELNELVITFDFSQGTTLSLDSASTQGLRTAGAVTTLIGINTSGTQQAIRITPASSPLAIGSGPVLRLFFRTNEYAFGTTVAPVDTVTVGGKSLEVSSDLVTYQPYTTGGGVFINDVLRGDANHDEAVNVGDAVFIINYAFRDGVSPITFEAGDANFDFMINVADAVYLINYIFRDGPPPNDI